MSTLFPRSIERGPIEAVETVLPQAFSYQFPRSIERGPIEALS